MFFRTEARRPNFLRALTGAVLTGAIAHVSAVAAHAQTIVDPQFVQFVPSPDHNAVLNGVPMVNRYDLEFYVLGDSIPLQVVNLGKPAPSSSGKIVVSFFPTLPIPGATYQAKISAVGPGGSAMSSPSNAFTFTGGCNYVPSPSSLSLAAAGGPASVDILTSVGCTWTPISSASWVTILTNGTSGPGVLSLNIAPNTGGSARTANVNIAGRVLNISQAAPASACTTPPSALTTSVSAAATGSSGVIGVSAVPGCNWQASSPAAWVTVKPPSGTGAGDVTYDVVANTSASARSTTLTVAGTKVAVSQAAAAGCNPAATTGSVSVPADGGSGSIGVSAAAGCTWKASSAATWATVAPTSGTGPGSVTYTIPAHTSTTARTTTLAIGNSSVTLTQAGASGCTPAVSATRLSVPAMGGSGAVSVTAQSGCTWTAVTSSSWLALSPASGSGNGAVGYDVSPNTSKLSRIATLTIAGKSITLTQTTSNCVRTVSQTSISMPAAGGAGSLAIGLTSACDMDWYASSPASWATVTPKSGATRSATVNYTIAPNTSSAARTATLLVNMQNVTVTQEGGTGTPTPCSASLSTGYVDAGEKSATRSVNLFTQSGCPWKATSNVSWVTIASAASGTGSAMITVKFAVNDTGARRVGTVTIAGQTLNVAQGR